MAQSSVPGSRWNIHSCSIQNCIQSAYSQHIYSQHTYIQSAYIQSAYIQSAYIQSAYIQSACSLRTCMKSIGGLPPIFSVFLSTNRWTTETPSILWYFWCGRLFSMEARAFAKGIRAKPTQPAEVIKQSARANRAEWTFKVAQDTVHLQGAQNQYIVSI